MSLKGISLYGLVSDASSVSLLSSVVKMIYNTLKLIKIICSIIDIVKMYMTYRLSWMLMKNADDM